MKQPKHTPGPWESVIREEQDGIWAYIGPVSDRKNDVLRMDACNENRQANARLIAAAPEMLRLLDECDTAFATIMIGRDHGLTPQAEAAIRELAPQVQAMLAKAKGE